MLYHVFTFFDIHNYEKNNDLKGLKILYISLIEVLVID